MAQLIEGQPQYAQGSGAKPYELKNVGGVYSCSCPAWRNQGAKIDRRTCKHLRALLGSAAEDVRIGGGTARPAPAAAPPAASRTVTTLPTPPGDETADDVLAEVFGKAVPADSFEQVAGRAAPRTVQAEFDGRIVTATKEDAQAILDRAASQGRRLRQDEKVKLHGPPILLAHPYEESDLDPAGWWWSEKLDGVRAYWNGTDFISRQGNVFQAPAWFKAGLPRDEALDGELWIGRKAFQRTISVVKRQDWGDGAKLVKYVVFDAPDHGGTFEARSNHVSVCAVAANVPHVVAHPHDRVRDRQHLRDELRRIEALGGEGLMIRKPGSLYEAGRSHTLLKVKPFKDAEAVVVGHEPGKGRHKGVLGALVVRMPSGKEFRVGTGLSDAERRSPPKVGATITYSYTELTNDGIPKCGAFVAVRDYE